MKLLDELQRRGISTKKKTANEYSSTCPVCGGTDRFCIWPKTNNYWCRGCGIKGDMIQFFRDIDGMTFPDAARAADQAEKIKGKADVIPIKKTSPPQKTPPTNQTTKTSANAPIIAEYDYCNHKGDRLFQVCRKSDKTFVQRRPSKKGDGSWAWDMKDVPLVLYRLPEILQAETVWICEGEKDVHTQESLGLCATTIPGGAVNRTKLENLQNKHSILDILVGKRVIITPDNDAPGKDHAQAVAEALVKGEITSKVKIVELPVVPGGDLTDFVQAAKTKGEAKTKLIDLVNETKPFTPELNSITVETLLNIKFEQHQDVIGSGVLPHNGNLLIAGESGVGKSMLREEIAIRLAMGWDWLSFEIPTSRKVLIIQHENSLKTEQTRVKYMMRGLGIDHIPTNKLTWLKRSKANRPDLGTQAGQARMLEIVRDERPEVVIYDCLSNLHNINENDNIKVRGVLDSLSDINEELGIACILIDHFGKPGKDNPIRTKDRFRGASAKIDWSYCALAFLVKPHEHKVLRRIENVKMRDAKEIKPILLERDEHFICHEVEEDTLVSISKVWSLLKNEGGELRNADFVDLIMKETGCGDRTARKAISDAEKDGYIIKYREDKKHLVRVAE